MYREQEARRQIVSDLQDLASKTLDVATGLLRIVETMYESDGADLKSLYEDVRRLDSEVYSIQKTLINEVMRYKPFIGDQTYIFYNLIVLIGDVVDEMDGAAFRLSHLDVSSLAKWELEWIRKVVNALHREVEAFREAIYFLAYNISSVYPAVERIIEIEEEIDLLHRKALVEVFNRERSSSKMLMWMEIIKMLESAADGMKKVGDVILSLCIL